MRIRVGFMLDHHKTKIIWMTLITVVERTGVQDHSEILRRQSRRNNTVRTRQCELA